MKKLSTLLKPIKAHPSWAIAAIFTAVWAVVAAGAGILWLAAIAAVAVWVLRYIRRDRNLLWTLLPTTVATLGLAMAALWTMQDPALQGLTGTLTGFTVACPALGLITLAWRPRIASPIPPTAVGIGAVLAAAGLCALTGLYAAAQASILATLLGVTGWTWRRHRRAAAAAIGKLTVTQWDWTHSRVGRAQVYVRGGSVLAVFPCRTARPGTATLARAVRDAETVARQLRIPMQAVQPVLTCPASKAPASAVGRIHGVSATVIITPPDQLGQVAAYAPRSHRRTRGPLIRAAITNTNPGRTA